MNDVHLSLVDGKTNRKLNDTNGLCCKDGFKPISSTIQFFWESQIVTLLIIFPIKNRLGVDRHRKQKSSPAFSKVLA